MNLGKAVATVSRVTQCPRQNSGLRCLGRQNPLGSLAWGQVLTFKRQFQDYYVFRTEKGDFLRIHLARSRQLIGIRSTRGTREYNEDRYRVGSLDLRGHQLGPDRLAGTAYFGIFDGHGGPRVADWLAANLHKQIENCNPQDVPVIMQKLRKLGGYFRRFPIPSALKNLMDEKTMSTTATPDTPLTLEQRLYIAYLSGDLSCIQSIPEHANDMYTSSTNTPPSVNKLKKKLEGEGSTASLAVLEPLDDKPFWESRNLQCTVAHVGDTKILLCETTKGEAIPLTSMDHHPDAVAEHERLRRYAGFVTTDSYGDSRILGMLQTSRAIGDAKLKKFGVTSEPDVTRRQLRGQEAAFLVLTTDGVGSVLSNQEIVDVVKQYDDPSVAAVKLTDFCEQLGAEDNQTAIVVRLAGWGKPMPDLTKDLRKYKSEEGSIMARRQAW